MYYEVSDIIKANGGGCKSMPKACMCSRSSRACSMQTRDAFDNFTICRLSFYAWKGRLLWKDIKDTRVKIRDTTIELIEVMSEYLSTFSGINNDGAIFSAHSGRGAGDALVAYMSSKS